MRPWIGLMLLVAACRHAQPTADERYGDVSGMRNRPSGSRGYVMGETSPDLRLRADSLAALDPLREAARAIGRGDLRYLAMCTFSCTPIVVSGDTVCLMQHCMEPTDEDIRVIPGTMVPPINVDGARLNSVATRYGERYNVAIRDYRRHHLAPRIGA